jgi:hypothetical protein
MCHTAAETATEQQSQELHRGDQRDQLTARRKFSRLRAGIGVTNLPFWVLGLRT